MQRAKISATDNLENREARKNEVGGGGGGTNGEISESLLQMELQPRK